MSNYVYYNNKTLQFILVYRMLLNWELKSVQDRLYAHTCGNYTKYWKKMTENERSYVIFTNIPS